MSNRNFFTINMAFGMEKTAKGWRLFNRFYKPLGWEASERVEDVAGEDYDEFYEKFTVKYDGFTNRNLETIFKNGEKMELDDNGKIIRIWFYNDKTNPLDSPSHWERYFEILKRLAIYSKAK